MAAIALLLLMAGVTRAATPSPVVATHGDTLSVVSLNIYHDKADWPKRLPLIVGGLRALQPDVIALQEVLQTEQLPNQARTIANALGYQLHFVSTDAPGLAHRYGNAILTRYPILAHSERRLQPFDDARTVAHLRIAVGDRAFDIYATHLHHTDAGDAIRRRQLQDVFAHIAQTSDGAPRILLGDFNTAATTDALQPVLAEYIDSYGSRHADPDAQPANTTLNPAFFDTGTRIDHIFASRGDFEVREAAIVLDRADANGTWPSDHFGLHATLRLRAPRGGERPWMDASLTPDARVAALLARMTQDEKFRLLRAEFTIDADKKPADAIGSAGYVPANARLGIPALQETDAGLGVTRDGLSGKGATSLPAGLATAASWDPGVAHAGGAMIGRQAWRKGFNVLLAGSVNLQRDPRNGRNFEYAGEDPLLAGTLVGEAIRGVQDQRVVSTMKHFAVNDYETSRNTHSADIDERAMHESDLLAFEIAHDIGAPGSVMCAYNKVNGTYACEHDGLLDGVLKRDWGFKGWVMSDWGGVHSGAKAALAGLDQQSAGEVFDKQVWFDKPLRGAVARGEVPQSRIDDMAGRVLRAMFANGLFDRPAQATAIDFVADAQVSQRTAEAGAVLLRNDGALLPLSREVKSIAVIGGHADKGVLAGGGSSSVNAPAGNAVAGLQPEGWPGPVRFHPSAPLAAIRALVPDADVRFDDGRDPVAAAALARNADVAIVFANQWAAESFDRPTMTLADGQDVLVAAVAAANPRTAVVLQANGPVNMPWLEDVRAVLMAWYPGSRGGEAIARLLFGEVAPSGRLPVSWPRDESQLPRPWIEGAGLGSKAPPWQRVNYFEGANVGYKWFAARNMEPLLPFGFGLGYTTFARGNLVAAIDGQRLRVHFDMTNTGTRAGADVGQVYLALPDGHATPLRLIGWHKAMLEPGETRRVGIDVDPRLLADYDVAARDWRIRGGRYRVWVGNSATDLSQGVGVDLPDIAVESADANPSRGHAQ